MKVCGCTLPYDQCCGRKAQPVVTPSCGNVFADLGFTQEDYAAALAEIEQLKRIHALQRQTLHSDTVIIERLNGENAMLQEDLSSSKIAWDTAQANLARYREACGNLMLDASEMRDKIAKLQAIIDKQLY